MKKVFVLLSLFIAFPAFAFVPIDSEPAKPYETMLIENTDPYQERVLLGDLEEFPDMYELTFDKEMEFSMQLKQQYDKNPQPFSLLMVKVNEDGSVSEVYRNKTPIEEWTKITDNVLGFNLLEDKKIVQTIPVGTYRIEVSTPINKGSYMLVLGDEQVESGYLATLGGILNTQQHFGFSWIRFLLSSYVHYPLGIIVVVVGIALTWRKRTSITKNV